MSNPVEFIEANLDHEFKYIILESLSNSISLAHKEERKITKGDCCDQTAKLVFDIIITRYPQYTEKFSEYEMVKVANNIFQNMDDRKIDYQILYPQIAERLLHYMSVRLMGVPSPYINPAKRNTYDDYSPFGQPGGFCNPLKLKMMDD